MSNLTEIRQAYERLASLLDQEILRRKGEASELRRFRRWLDVSFYMLGWGNFEYLTRKKAEDLIAGAARSKGLERHAWSYLQQNVKGLPVRQRLELVFHGDEKIIATLNRSYDVRNEAAHDHKKLPPEVDDLPSLLQDWEDLVDKF